MMRFYTQQHRFYCGLDLHTRTLSLCVLDSAGIIVLEATLPPEPERLLAALVPYRDDLVVGCECLFAWYWLADRARGETLAVECFGRSPRPTRRNVFSPAARTGQRPLTGTAPASRAPSPGSQLFKPQSETLGSLCFLTPL